MLQPVIVALVVVLGAVVLGSGIWVPLLYWLAERRAQRRFDALAAGFGLPAGGKNFSLPVAGRSFAVTLRDPGRSSPRTLEVTLHGPRDPAAPPILQPRGELPPAIVAERAPRGHEEARSQGERPLLRYRRGRRGSRGVPRASRHTPASRTEEHA